MSTGHSDPLARLAVLMVRQRHRVYAGWLVAVVTGLIGLPFLLGSVASPPMEVSGSDSQRAAAVISAGLPSFGSHQMVAVLHSPDHRTTDPVFDAAINAAIAALGPRDGVDGMVLLPRVGDVRPVPALTSTLEPLRPLFRDEHTAYLLIGSSGDDRQRQDRVPRHQAILDEAMQTTSAGAVRAHLLGGAAFGKAVQEAEIADLMRIELVAVPAAILVLLIGLRAPVAALVPVVIAGASVLTTLGLFALIRGIFPVDGMLLIGVNAIGLGIGIDYALFVMNRYREELAVGADPLAAIRTASATTGRTVVYSALILLFACTSLFLVRWHIFAVAAVGTLTVIAVTAVAAVTLLPAVLVSLTKWLEWGSGGIARPGPAQLGEEVGTEGRLTRWANHLMRHPWPYTIAVTAGLLVAATPAPNMTLGFDAEARALAGSPVITGSVITERDVPGLAAMVTILLSRPADTPEPDTEPLLAALRADPEVAAVSKRDNGIDLTAVLAIPKHLPTSPSVVDLVRRIRSDIAPTYAPSGLQVTVGGPSAVISDILTETSTKLWWVFGWVLALMFAVLVVMLRSLVLPLKAILMSLLATGASFGLTVLVFQHDGGDQASGLANQGMIWPQVPLIVFVVLFGLSTDYELFLVRRIQEEYLATGDNRRSVATGLQSTARSITLAAVILAVGFGSLLVSEINGLKSFGFAIAVALIIDATLIRLVLVPALMQIMGRWNWWFPSSVKRSCPRGDRALRIHEPVSTLIRK
ncbi:MMPL family transporter [Nocardia iowensis]|uniref:MMPL family transporter n=1 Tax=Nocardia iowensis TaxID=204891 RepID=A0ABX8RT75_NOCIO|nr:MMPL family transporter [Nocardia iowensis]QXN92843.1 MMPL family transporter [Nocardia iowensis]